MNTTSGRVKIGPVADGEYVDGMIQTIMEQRELLLTQYRRLLTMDGYWVPRRVTSKWRGKKFNYGRSWGW